MTVVSMFSFPESAPGLRKCITTVLLWLCCTFTLIAQTDTLQELRQVEVRSYFEEKSLLNTPASVSIIDAQLLGRQNDQSLVSTLNTVPGVRMEERSPGSYRLSVRGSLLRSPFGIRNLKMYLDDFPLTDAGGNSYLNLIDAGNVNRIEILKGPDASIFGANSGGVVIINPVPKKADSGYALAGITGGSFASLHQKFVVQEAFTKYRFNFTQAFQQSDGYRENSSLKRQYIQGFQQWNYISRAQIKMLFLYSNLRYQTPGGLTLQQATDAPRSARPATAVLPGAAAQQAGIYNRMVYGGLSHEIQVNNHLRHVLTLFGSQTAFENPFITNYETRDEYSLGVRSFLEVSGNMNRPVTLKWQTGLEAQRTQSLIANYGNRSGQKDTLQARDDIGAFNHFYFTRLAVAVRKKLVLETALSINGYRYTFRNKFPISATAVSVPFTPQWMPRFAASYLLTRSLSWRASVSRGYSAPSIAEVRSSNLLINTALEPESGWNYETGIRLFTRNAYIDLCFYHFRLDRAIVRRLDANGNEFFVNAGGTSQSGAELQGTVPLVKPRKTGFFRSIEVQTGVTAQHFLFRNYSDGIADYSGNRLTGTPEFIQVTGLHIRLPKRFALYVQYNYTARIPLNDANSVYANEYHLLQARATCFLKLGSLQAELVAGADNLLNQRYSLGNDLNAFGGRYYNPAPPLNYYAGIHLIL